MSALVAACGGGSSGSDVVTPKDVTISAAVVDAAVEGAKVCLYADGAVVKDSKGTPVCSGLTNAQGQYSLTVPSSVASTANIMLLATKGTQVWLASNLGNMGAVSTAAGSDGVLTAGELAAAQITHFTTADAVLADTNDDGIVSAAEATAYVADATKRRELATVLKAAIDYQLLAAKLLAQDTPDTLKLAQAAKAGRNLGETGFTLTQWLQSPASGAAEIYALVTQEDLQRQTFAGNYQLVEVIKSQDIPPPVFNQNAGAELYCEVGTGGTVTVAINFDASAGRFTITHPEGTLTGTYNAETGAMGFSDSEAPSVSMTTPTVTYYHAGSSNLVAKLDRTTGKITGELTETSTNTWSLDGSSRTCTSVRTITATLL